MHLQHFLVMTVRLNGKCNALKPRSNEQWHYRFHLALVPKGRYALASETIKTCHTICRDKNVQYKSILICDPIPIFHRRLSHPSTLADFSTNHNNTHDAGSTERGVIFCWQHSAPLRNSASWRPRVGKPRNNQRMMSHLFQRIFCFPRVSALNWENLIKCSFRSSW